MQFSFFFFLKNSVFSKYWSLKWNRILCAFCILAPMHKQYESNFCNIVFLCHLFGWKNEKCSKVIGFIGELMYRQRKATDLWLCALACLAAVNWNFDIIEKKLAFIIIVRLLFNQSCIFVCLLNGLVESIWKCLSFDSFLKVAKVLNIRPSDNCTFWEIGWSEQFVVIKKFLVLYITELWKNLREFFLC